MRTCAGHWNTCKRAWRRQKKGAHHVHTSLQADCRSPAHCPSHPGLAPFPAFASILAAFLHAQGNYNALHRFLRGVITSTWGVIGYFLVAALCLGKMSLVATYALAVAVALVLNACIICLQKRHVQARKR